MQPASSSSTDTYSDIACSAEVNADGNRTAVNFSTFRNDFCPVDGDCSHALREALQYCQKRGITKLIFPAGTYHFCRDGAAEALLFVANNDSSIKRISFMLDGFSNFEIDGGGSLFLFDGFLVPIVVQNCRNITLRNFRIDFKRTFHSEGRILAVGESEVDVLFADEFPYRISNGLLTFAAKSGDENCNYPAGSLLEFDPTKKEPAYLAHDYYIGQTMHACDLGARRVRVKVEGFKGTLGNTLVFASAHRLVPGIVVQDCDEISLCDIIIHHAGGMGVIAQRSSDILLERVSVTPSAGRTVSTTADATHFANCSGEISVLDCLFENQMDDAINVHGVYVRISKKLSARAIEVQLVHPQQRGFDFLKPDQKVEFVDSKSLVTYGEQVIQRVNRINSEFTRLDFWTTLPEELKVNDVIASIHQQPDVVIRGCTMRNNRARGILLGSRGRIKVESNVFHSPGAAILLEGDGSFWYEQAGVRDLAIRRNLFDNCNYGVWGKGVIEVGAGIDPAERCSSRYNRNIVIEENVFRTFDDVPIIFGYCIHGLVYRHNKVESSTAYPAQRTGLKRFEIADSDCIQLLRESALFPPRQTVGVSSF